MGRGRKRKSGNRTPSGQLSRAGQARDQGNVRVQERRELFRHFIDDKGLTFEGTSVGRLWIVGGFDGHDIDPSVMRDCLLDYGALYWSEWPMARQAADYLLDGQPGFDGRGWRDPDPKGEAFMRHDDTLRSAGRETRAAVIAVAVDGHLFPDEDCSWVSRIIATRCDAQRMTLARAGQKVPAALKVTGPFASTRDWAMLGLLCDGALALARGRHIKGTGEGVIRSAA